MSLFRVRRGTTPGLMLINNFILLFLRQIGYSLHKAYSGFKSGVMAMGETDVFTFADNERDGNLSFREREGYTHDGNAANESMYNALRFFWNAERVLEHGAETGLGSREYQRMQIDG